MKLSFHATVPGPIEEVYEYVTAVGPDGPVDRVLFAQKYGEPVEEYDGDAVLTRDTDEAGDGEDTFWLCNFIYPTRRTMEAVESRWADREDVFEAVRGGTRWTVTFNPKTGGLQGLAQWLYFLAVGKYRIGVPVLSPVVHHFRRKARGEFDAADDSADQGSGDQGSGSEEPPAA